VERVAVQWQRLVGFMKALDLLLLHWAMGAVLHCHTNMAIEMASDGGTFVRCRRLFRLIKIKLNDHVVVLVHLN
jgi:hypothetical protein